MSSHSCVPVRHDDNLLRAPEVADVLRVSVRQVWSLVARGLLPQPVRLGGCTRWRARDIRAAIEAASAKGQP